MLIAWHKMYKKLISEIREENFLEYFGLLSIRIIFKRNNFLLFIYLFYRISLCTLIVFYYPHFYSEINESYNRNCMLKINNHGLDHRISTVFQSAIKISFVCWMLLTSSYSAFVEYIKSVCVWFQLDKTWCNEVNRYCCMIRRITLGRPCSRPLTENKCTDCLRPSQSACAERNSLMTSFIRVSA